MKTIDLCGFPYGAQKILEVACNDLGYKTRAIPVDDLQSSRSYMALVWISAANKVRQAPLNRPCIVAYKNIHININELNRLLDIGFMDFLYMGIPLDAKKIFIKNVINRNDEDSSNWLSKTEAKVYEAIKGNYHGVKLEDVCERLYGEVDYNRMRSVHKHISNINKKIKAENKDEIIENVGDGVYQWKKLELAGQKRE